MPVAARRRDRRREITDRPRRVMAAELQRLDAAILIISATFANCRN